MESLQNLKSQIEELRHKGLTADEIVKTLSLHYDIINTVSSTNQELLRSRAEQGASEDQVKSEAGLISLLRQYRLEDNLSPTQKEEYMKL